MQSRLGLTANGSTAPADSAQTINVNVYKVRMYSAANQSPMPKSSLGLIMARGAVQTQKLWSDHGRCAVRTQTQAWVWSGVGMQWVMAAMA